MLRKWGMLVLALLITPMLALAQNTGKVAGVVTDGETGDPLPGASVVLLGTQLGAISDVDGNYFIIGVPVGSYDVQASFVGYGTQTVTGVEISSGYTREINFTLSPGVQLDEIVVEYERPLIQKDAVGVPKIVTGEDIVNLPVRGATAVAAIQAGVVNKEGTGTLNVRGGRGEEVDYYIDGVKVIGSSSLPQSAVQEQEMVIGNISAKYGDAMSGIINITTKSGSTKFFGSFEGITSQALDPYGYNLVSGAIGGPIAGNKVNFFAAAEYTQYDDSDPSAFGEIRLPDDVLADLEAAPMGFRQVVNGNSVVIPVPAEIASGARLLVDDHGVPVRVDNSGTPLADQAADGGHLYFYTCAGGTTDEVCSQQSGAWYSDVLPAGVDLNTLSLTLVNRAEVDVNPDVFTIDKKKVNRAYDRISMSGNLVFNVLENARLRVGGRYVSDNSNGDQGTYSHPYAINFPSKGMSKDFQAYATWTHYLSTSTFFQLQADVSRRNTESWDPRFGSGENDWFNYGDIDNVNNAAFQTIRGAKVLNTDASRLQYETINGTRVQVPSFRSNYVDGSSPTFDVVSSLVMTVGGRFVGYGKGESGNLRFNASATTQVGLHQIEFGGEYEQRTYRSWGINAAGLSRIYDDRAQGSTIENVGSVVRDRNGDGRLDTLFVTSYDDLLSDYSVLDNYAGGYGYDLTGRNKVETQDLAQFLDKSFDKPLSYYNQAPFKPIYYGGYVQDKIEFRDIVLNMGLRVDVFDNNQWVMKDKFQRRPACQASNLGQGPVTVSLPSYSSDSFVEKVTDCGAIPAGGVPSNIGDDYTVFYNSAGVVGYRSPEGAFFDVGGQQANAGDILLTSNPRNIYAEAIPDMFEDYTPQVTVMPRIGVSFPVTDQALFFARYGVVSQRPSGALATLGSLAGTGGASSGLLPQRTTEYELGFRQRVGARAALTISGFFRQIENLIQVREVRGTTPNVYSQNENVDFGTVKGLEFGFDLRRSGGVAANVNYTLSFSDGTGSSSGTTGTIVWVDETPPNFISPLDFDQRHKFNVNIDYRLGKGEGPSVAGTKIFENFGANILLTAGSGYPFTPVIEPFNLAGAARATQPKGGINSGRMPWSSRIDLKVDRRFTLSGKTSLTASFWVQNLLDQVNTNNVWRFTGLPDDDGFLSTAEGAQFIGEKPIVAEELYWHRLRSLGNVGIPRMTRFSLRLDF
jgi:hypothetical protein